MIGGRNREEQLAGQPAITEEPGIIFINRNLFSSYYLGTLLAREVRTHLGETGTRIPANVRRRLQSQWDRVSPTLGDSTSYARTRQAWIEPLLGTLGYEPLEDAHAAAFDEGALPDGYYLYSPVSQQVEQTHQAGEEHLLLDMPTTPEEQPTNAANDDDEDHRAPTVVLLSLLSWGTDFDRPFASARRRGDMPHKLMERLLAAGPAQWGLLCNGRRLRLLKRNVVAGRQQYFEVDLESLFEGGSDRDFDTFWTLFRAQAFQPDDKGRCLLDVVDEGSRKHAEGVSSTLKDSVFRAIETLMSTLVSRAQELTRQPIDPTDEMAARRRALAAEALSNLSLLYQQSLVLLYRLLFVLYAESRTLLPIDNAVYRDSYSLEPLRDEIMEPNVHYLPGGFRLWETIQALFRLIHQGCTTSQLVVPAYNGDLFSPQSTALLNAIRVPDDALAGVLRELSVTPPTRERGRERIDYQDLGIEQLGAVYEGLLEFEPKVAAEPMVEIRYKDGYAVIPAREQREYPIARTFETGQFYLGHGAGRKTSGSYYTPQPLVDFVVRRTLGPLVQSKTAEQIFELKVVDPAMGSGAFLVGACLFLADAYARALQSETANDTSMDTDATPDLAAQEDELSEEATRPYRRLVAERCLYGVDLNPMAVELAKVSLWLTTLAGDKPLTFLDANLRCGNSLIGAPLRPYKLATGREQTIDTIHPEAHKRLLKARGSKTQRKSRGEDDAFQLTLFEQVDIPHAMEPIVGRRQWIAETPSDSVARVHEKAALFRRQVEQDEQRRILKTICDLWVASWFWRQPPADVPANDPHWPPPLDGQIYRELVLLLRGEQRQFATFDAVPYLQEVERIAEQVRPFHWELEFPEIYFEPDARSKANPGFDAVLGNPPWDIVMSNSLEFFSAYDPDFRELERVEALQRQNKLLENRQIRDAWETYTQSLDAQVNYFSFSETYSYQVAQIDGKRTRGHINTYKLFLERTYGLLCQHGMCGMIVPSGFYNDQGSTGLRQLFLELAQISYLLCFENRRSVFPIDSRFKFVLFGYHKQSAQDAFDAAFMLHDLDVLAAPHEHTLSVPAPLIRHFSPDTLSIMEFRSQGDVDIVQRIYGNWPLLGEQIENTWNITFAREFNFTDDRHFFNQEGIGWPLYEGKMIHQYTHRYSDAQYWVELELGKEELARREIKRVEDALGGLLSTQPQYRNISTNQGRIAALLEAHGRGPLTANDIRLHAEVPRLTYREVAANTNERTLLFTILPSQIFQVYTIFYGIPLHFDAQKALSKPHNIRGCYEPSLPAPVQAYLCGVFNSFTLDYVARFKITMHVNMFHVYQLPIPRLTPNDPHCRAIARRVARLVCIGPEFDELRQELLGDVNVWVLPFEEKEARQRLQNEIDALVAHLYELSKDDLEHILYAPYTFPLVKREIKDGVMAAFARVEEMLEERQWD